jgi:hypothetical protein
MDQNSEMSPLKIAKIVRCTGMNLLRGSPASYTYNVEHEMGRYTYREPTAMELYNYAMKVLAEGRASDEKTHIANAPGLITNKIIAENIESFMKSIGMPSSYQEVDQRSRARKIKYITKAAGYIEDMRKHLVLNDGYDYNVSQFAVHEKSYKEFYEKALKDEEEAKKKLEREEKKKVEDRKANLEIASLIVKYGLPEDSDWLDIYETLREKDKYLDLAAAMLDVRNDWNDGPDRVESALGRFKVETAEDKEIDECIGSLLGNWDNDGRVFRDCEYSYDVLFSKVDPQLYKDYELAEKRANPEGY